ncbi:MAG: transcriptional regulator GcvA [Alphaproteobacteria bacterium]|nr:transcriptional regulator GcvA [Alphaproteobacteria bacterium]
MSYTHYAVRLHIPTLSVLQAFESAARHLSFTRAAVELNVSQSGISRLIRSLEEQLGVELFLRSRQRVELTEAGSTYLPEIRACLDRIEASTINVLAYRRAAGILNLSTLPTFGTKWLVPHLAEFHRRHPGIRINFTVRTEPFSFSGSGIDAAIHFGAPALSDVVADRLMGESLVPVCSPALLRGRTPPVTPAELVRLPLLQLIAIPDAWSNWFQAAGQSSPGISPHARFEHFAMAIQAAICGLGVLLVPHFLVADDLSQGRLIVVSRTMIRTESAYYFIFPVLKKDLPAIRAFRAWLAETARATERECEAVTADRPELAAAET